MSVTSPGPRSSASSFIDPLSANKMPTDDPMRSHIQHYASALKSFTSSPSKFRIVHSIPPERTLPSPATLYVLDSSFNPPTLAHLRIATSAILQDTQPSPSPKRLLLLLATQNADKAPKPAAFEQRLLMMQLFAEDLLSTLRNSDRTTSELIKSTENIGVDICVTKLPYFMDKAKAIEESDAYPRGPPQVHLTGFDTLIRILDSKYYPPSHTLEPVQPFLEKHRLRVTYRTDGQWGAREMQDAYLNGIGEGKRDEEGAKREWVSGRRIEMVEGRKEGEDVISSTRVRDAVKSGDEGLLKKLVTTGVADWIAKENLYKEN